jgi:hypothetical protein
MVREEEGLELLDAGASTAFAVVDHQIAHIYLNNPEAPRAFCDLLRQHSGVEQVLDREDQKPFRPRFTGRSGDLGLVAAPGTWFSYDYWLEDARGA